VFITGASRGIGKAIALKCAKDGANIVIAAKTAQPHPKLPGTIFTAAKELEEAGGKCLACEVDIRNEEQVVKAVDEAVRKFGGIDVLVNNASAIHLTNTSDTPMKKFDLMNGVNMRGTFICSKYCIPYLQKGTNPHILNLSPPLNMNSRWFKDHVAYTMAKYGMSMCTLGMAEELKPLGIAVNSLWPRTAIYTAAMEMLSGGTPDAKNQCRSPDIVADAAYVILNRDSKAFTGQFTVDEDVLKEHGVKDFSPYQYTPDANLLPDFFLNESLGMESFRMSSQSSSTEGATATTGATIEDPELAKTFGAVQSLLNADLVKSINAVYVFDLKDAGPFYLDLKTGSGSTGPGNPADDVKADVTMTLKKADFIKMFAGQMNPTSAFMSGKLKIKGDLGLAMKLEKILKKMKPKL
jgi:NAD(P)-dependent dehydrogenase (short-subunit alcohol dehydrogenase family)